MEFASGVFGVVPSEGYAARLQPRHSRRRQQISPAERQLLQTVGAQLESAEQELEQAVTAVDGGEKPADASLV